MFNVLCLKSFFARCDYCVIIIFLKINSLSRKKFLVQAKLNFCIRSFHNICWMIIGSLTHCYILNFVKYLCWSLFGKIVNSWKPIIIFAKILHCRCLAYKGSDQGWRKTMFLKISQNSQEDTSAGPDLQLY